MGRVFVFMCFTFCSVFSGSELFAQCVIDTISGVNISCKGDSTGTATVTPSSGTTPYTYQWDDFNSQTDSTATGLPVGIYRVTVTDAVSCTVIDSITLTEPAAALSTDFTDTTAVACNGGSTGAATVTPSGGTTPYTYSWSNAQTDSTATGLPIGTYYVTVTDSNSCTTIDSILITEPSILALSITDSVMVACNGDSTGSVTITPSGGTSPYTYQWDDFNNQTDSMATGLPVGIYRVTVTDASSCTAIDSITLTEPIAALSATFTDTTAVTCSGGGDGAATITPSGGTAPYNYAWSGGSNPVDSANVGLSAGDAIVLISDFNGCILVDTITITEPAPITLSFDSIMPTCNGGSDGVAIATPFNGISPYIYVWSAGGAVTDSMNIGLAAGTYYVTVSDVNNCVVTDSITIAEPSAVSISKDSTMTNCNGSADGTAVSTPSGGTPPYTYAWSAGGAMTDSLNTGLSAGTYYVTVSDSLGCTAIDSVGVIQPLVITFSSVPTNVSCFGGNDGMVDLTVTGGTSPYAYNWSNGDTTEDTDSLFAGEYNMTVTDANNCIAASEINEVEQNYTPSSSFTTYFGVYDLAFINDSDFTQGTIWGAGAPTTFELSLNFNSPVVLSQIALQAGQFNGNFNKPLQAMLYRGTSSGTLLATITPEYALDTTNLSNSQGDLLYTLVITPDTNGYASLLEVICFGVSEPLYLNSNITQPDSLMATFSTTNISCNGLADGGIDLTTNGGILPYAYSWSNAETLEDIDSLAASSYSVTITDSMGCSLIDSAVTIEPAVLSGSIASTNANCNAEASGTIDLTVSGGTIPYSYQWSNGDSIEDLSNVMAGTYFVTVLDTTNCSFTDSVSISEPTDISMSSTSVDASCNGDTDGSIDLTVSGGIPPYSYQWTSGDSVEDPDSLVAGTYYVTVTDSLGCAEEGQVINSKLSYSNSSDFNDFLLIYDLSFINDGDTTAGTIWGGSAPSAIELSVSFSAPVKLTSVKVKAGQYNGDFNKPAQMNLYRGTSSDSLLTVFNPSYLMQPYSFSNDTFSTLYTFLIAPNGSGYASIREIECYGISSEDTINAIISEPAAIVISIAAANVSCYGGNDGAADLTASGGSSGYSYNWSNSASSEDISGLTAGSYFVTVADVANCTASETTFITQPDSFALNLASNNTLEGSCNGDATASVIGGTTPYTYLWNDTAQTGATATGLCEATYSVTITDAMGCTLVGSIAVDADSVIIGINDVGFADAIQVYPNPNNGIFELKIKNEKSKDNNIELKIFNLLGESIYQSSIANNQSSITIDLSSRAEGIYFLTVKVGENYAVKRVVVY